jgi:hypothetical protein
MTRVSGYDPIASRRLGAIDVIITKPSSDRVGALFTTRSTQILNRRDGAVAALESILRAADASARIDKASSHLALEDNGIFLWLVVQQRDQPQLTTDLRLSSVQGISGQDIARRTADLRSGVDFTRPNFLTAVAEADTLGPIEVSFAQSLNTELRSFLVRIFLDGGFEINRKETHIPAIVDAGELMATATQTLAYSLIPRINQLYRADSANWAVRKIEVIEGAMNALEDRYRELRAALRAQLHTPPTSP